ncbi:hypothetical protein ACSBR2_022984 [Camellia fascicularis]
MPSVYGARLTTFEDSEKESEYGYVRKDKRSAIIRAQMDKASIIKYAIDYIQELHEQERRIQADLIQLESGKLKKNAVFTWIKRFQPCQDSRKRELIIVMIQGDQPLLPLKILKGINWTLLDQMAEGGVQSRYVKLTKDQGPLEDIKPGELNQPIDVPQIFLM